MIIILVYDKYVKNTKLYLSHPLVSLTICLKISYSFFQPIFLWMYKPKFVFDRNKDRQLNWNCYKNICAFIQNVVVYTCSMTAYNYALKIDSLSFEFSCPIYWKIPKHIWQKKPKQNSFRELQFCSPVTMATKFFLITTYNISS